MARLRGAPSTQPAAPPAKATRQALKEKTNTARSKAPLYENDGNVEDLVNDARPRRGQARKAAQKENELVMAGGLGLAGSEADTAPRTDPALTTDELAKSDAPALTVKTNRRAPRATRKAVHSAAQSKVMDDMKKRMQATARKEVRGHDTVKAPALSEPAARSPKALPTKAPSARKSTDSAVERSEFSISPSPPPPGKLKSVEKSRMSLTHPGSALRSGTPAAETSILALKNFKRRPRQPSMLQMVQQRTASARPSAVHAPALEDASVFDIEDGDDEGEDFAPDAEGTPLHVSKAKAKSSVIRSTVPKSNQKTAAASLSVSAARKRKSDEADVSTSALETLNAKRQKSTGREHRVGARDGLRSLQTDRRSSSDRQITPQPTTTSDVQIINSPPSSTPPTEPSSSDRRRLSIEPNVVVPSTEEEQDDVHYVPLNDTEDDHHIDVPNGTMAEPASSSPLPSDPIGTQRTDIMADPLTQVSPPPPEREKAKKESKAMTTATLQSLLPKRRLPLKPRHRKSEYDIDSGSDDDPPLDESRIHKDDTNGKNRRKTKAAPKGGKKTPAPKSKTRQSRAPLSSRKSTAVPGRKSTAPPTRKKAAKTYGRANTSDKENEDDGFESLDENDDSALPDTSMSMVEAVQSKEIEEAKKKFAEVDDWGMEFESMSMEEGRSSSQQWR